METAISRGWTTAVCSSLIAAFIYSMLEDHTAVNYTSNHSSIFRRPSYVRPFRWQHVVPAVLIYRPRRAQISRPRRSSTLSILFATARLASQTRSSVSSFCSCFVRRLEGMKKNNPATAMRTCDVSGYPSCYCAGANLAE